MKSYVEQLQAYIAANPPKYHFCNGESVLQMLYFSYTESNPIVDPKIRSGFRVLRRYIKNLPRDQEEIVFIPSATCAASMNTVPLWRASGRG